MGEVTKGERELSRERERAMKRRERKVILRRKKQENKKIWGKIGRERGDMKRNRG